MTSGSAKRAHNPSREITSREITIRPFEERDADNGRCRLHPELTRAPMN
jgi:hypothetical protein